MLFFKRNRPKVVATPKSEGFSGWQKCSGCQELVHSKELTDHLQCCPKCGHHHRMSAQQRIQCTADSGTFCEMDANLRPLDPLEFTDSIPYKKRIENSTAKSDINEAIVTGRCRIDGIPSVLCIMDFSFMGGSMGSVVGEKFTRAVEVASAESLPLVSFACSGGARMQEGVFSLLQMAKTSCALQQLSEKHLPYISVLTDPTTGGVTASFASLGDVILAEPGSLICFAGPRVIEQVIGHKLPEGAQKPQFLKEHGMVDQIVSRTSIKQELSKILRILTKTTDKRSRHLLST